MRPDKIISASVEWSEDAYGALPLEKVILCYVGGFKATFPAVGLKAARDPKPFIPTSLQAKILEVLDGVAMRTDALAVAVGRDRSQLFKKGGINELTDETRRLVVNDRSIGYYRPDSLPPEMLEQP